MIRGNRES